MAKAIAAWGGAPPTAASTAAHETPRPAPPATEKTAEPAGPQAKIETAPLAIVASVVRLGGPAALAQAVASSDVHERAKRRARVILSDLSMYHREELLKAAGAPDPKQELGTLWRDAVLSYNEVASPEIRSVTNYLEEELDRYLVQLRSG